MQIIIAGITTDVSISNTSIAALHKMLIRSFTSRCSPLSLIEEGYIVYANADASGALSERISSDANDRLRAAGVHVTRPFFLRSCLRPHERLEEHSWLFRIVALL